MTEATFKDMQKRHLLVINKQRVGLEHILESAKEQYLFACNNFGNISEQAGFYDRIVCSLQEAIEALSNARR